jgi:hypothetical protein
LYRTDANRKLVIIKEGFYSTVIMSSAELVPANPATIASPSAERVGRQPDVFARLPEDNRILSELEATAKDLDFTDEQYFVETSRGLSIPASFEATADHEITLHSFYKLAFEGVFRGYSKVQIGKIIGYGSVRALCLAFEDVTLLPFFDKLPEDHIFHVPALAVDSIDQTS